jgi:ankyrin repeat protein
MIMKKKLNPAQTLISIIENNKSPELPHLLRIGVGFKHTAKRHIEGYTLLHYAVEQNDLKGVQALLNSGTNPNIWNNGYRYTPLDLAAARGYNPIIEILLAAGADIENSFAGKSQYRMTPMHYAATNGRLDTIRCLLDHGAALTPKDSLKRTPLDLTQKNGADGTALLLSHAEKMGKVFRLQPKDAPDWVAYHRHLNTAAQNISRSAGVGLL